MSTRFPLIALSLAAACSAAFAGTEYGNVIASKAVVAQVTVPQQQCTEQQAAVPPHTSGGGALLGALVGGLVGHNLGEGFGRAAATGLGAVAGSVIGDRTEAANTLAETAPVRSCQTVNTVENRVIGYDITYDYNGQRYTTRLAQDPGDRIALNVTVAPQQDSLATPTVGAAPVSVTGTVVVPATVAIDPVAVYVPSVRPVYVGPVAPRLSLAWGGYWHHGR